MNTPEEYMEMAKDSLADARTLAGKGGRSDREFLESMSRGDRLVDHADDCGHCGMQIVMAEAARELLADGEILDGIAKWSRLTKIRWEETKYFKLYQSEKAAGRDPRQAFEERGWEM